MSLAPVEIEQLSATRRQTILGLVAVFTTYLAGSAGHRIGRYRPGDDPHDQHTRRAGATRRRE
jgi:hypothetical protein